MDLLLHLTPTISYTHYYALFSTAICCWDRILQHTSIMHFYLQLQFTTTGHYYLTLLHYWRSLLLLTTTLYYKVLLFTLLPSTTTSYYSYAYGPIAPHQMQDSTIHSYAYAFGMGQLILLFALLLRLGFLVTSICFAFGMGQLILLVLTNTY